MKFNRVINLTPESLAPEEILGEPGVAEWKEPAYSAQGVYDASGACGLMLRCTVCNHVMLPAETTETTGGAHTCSDCGSSAFDVRMQIVRRVEPVPELTLRLTGTGDNRFLHIDHIPAGQSAYYTTDGSAPGPDGQLYRHPMQVPPSAAVIRAICHGEETKSQEVSLELKPGTGMPSAPAPKRTAPSAPAAPTKKPTKKLPKKPTPEPAPEPAEKPKKEEDSSGCGSWWWIGIIYIIYRVVRMMLEN